MYPSIPHPSRCRRLFYPGPGGRGACRPGEGLASSWLPCGGGPWELSPSRLGPLGLARGPPRMGSRAGVGPLCHSEDSFSHSPFSFLLRKSLLSTCYVPGTSAGGLGTGGDRCLESSGGGGYRHSPGWHGGEAPSGSGIQPLLLYETTGFFTPLPFKDV